MIVKLVEAAKLHNLILVHYSADPLREVHSVEQDPEREPMKPKGLWVSVENDPDEGWFEWCKPSLGIGKLAYATPIYLAEGASVLLLDTTNKLLAFTRTYIDTCSANIPGTRFKMYGDWAKLAQDYDGLIIAPYNYSLRLDRRTFWYYGWDCASGCIWNARAIERIGQSQRIMFTPEERQESGELATSVSDYMSALRKNGVGGVEAHLQQRLGVESTPKE